MIRRAVISLAAALACCSCAASGPSYFGFEVGVGDAPPPPHVVFSHHPRYVVVRGSGVYVVTNAESDYDMFRYGPYWYLCYDGYWYRSRGYEGPFAVIDVRSVPRAVISVPPGHWKHPPHRIPPGRDRNHGRGGRGA